ncbi:unnamed protein product [Polarella glacialis]|uniref:Uncharacterized protein n=1 Tax=Polarella glacialis TaxID=89957 RepID=A0A813EWJ0_POLGL|nr:unnamed protein product [Polarella glacialis]
MANGSEQMQSAMASRWCSADGFARNGTPTSQVKWFSLELGPAQAPWLFKEGKGSSWASTPAEMLGAMVAIQAFDFPVKQEDLLSPGSQPERTTRPTTLSARRCPPPKCRLGCF